MAKCNQEFPIIYIRYQINNLKKIHSPLYFDRQNQMYCSLRLQDFRRDHLKRENSDALLVNIRLSEMKVTIKSVKPIYFYVWLD